ncbi:hypothetical protein LRP49_04040 [Enterovibrio sp. ZSDZ35]|uniref:Uncharacterized protein n=1 Tax=Enterovibrio qingdaonensis TaxID=2899818 RepID=A0ABT5QHB8_9GAMM|nr:hypothetical protein [Enterovibrio sp. ZSDZ35]MDD1780366.1 hypothetical protein [Enterovibrio sp. ZSDZ35]
MNGLEFYIKYKAKYDTATGSVSTFVYGKEYARHRMFINLVILIAVIIGAAIYGKHSGNYYYFKMVAILGVVDIAVITYRWFKL